MTKQWHNPKIPQKPCNRYNPSLKQPLSSTYRPWYMVVAVLACLVGIALIGCAAETKVLSSDVSDEVFHLWIGIPLVFLGLCSLACFILKKKKIVIFFLVVALIVMVVCAVGSLVAGVRYWMDGWQLSKRLLDDEKCTAVNNVCICTGQEKASLPVEVDDCDNFKTLVYLIIAEIALSAIGFVASTIGVFLSFMTICCGPWMYMEWYDENEDPDYPQDAVRHVAGNVNASYGGGNKNPYSKSAY